MKMIKGQSDNNQAINNRESWLKVILILLFSFIISWKVMTTPLNIDFSDFDFSDFLSLQLALFAIILSLVFYLKANETSNKFYDSTYKFTNDTSVLLGRIEAGFGERLRHLDEGYTGLIDKFDRIPIDVKKVEEQVVEEAGEIKEKERELNRFIETLAEKAKLQDNEKKELFINFKNTESELNNARADLAFLVKKLSDEQNKSSPNILSKKLSTSMNLLISEIGMKTICQGNIEKVQKRLDVAKIHPNIVKYLIGEELLDSNNKLTEYGLSTLRKYIYTKFHTPAYRY